MSRDSSTLSNYGDFRIKHTIAKFDIDFRGRTLIGDFTHTVLVMKESKGSTLVLDNDNLDIHSVHVDHKEAKWSFRDAHKTLGTPLAIEIGSETVKGQEIQVQIRFKTPTDCAALVWLSPEQTAGKKHPYMFSQCQPICARSLFPCQDTPDSKATFEIFIKSPLMVLSGALAQGIEPAEDGKSIYAYKQDVVIPSYLFAIASGDIVTTDIGPRSKVATEPAKLEAVKWEFEADTDLYLKAAEKLICPYVWGTYNILVLPPAYPFGGMEHPVFTFVTPTIVSGDRQNTAVIAHEMCHSWSGNLVSTSSWGHFWLNEGWCNYLERRVVGAVYGEKQRSFEAIKGWKGFVESVKNFGKEQIEFTKLVIDIKDTHPNEVMSEVPYEKGSTFLWVLETLVGLEKWDKFIPHYFKKWEGKSLDSFEFKSTLLDFFASDEEATKLLKEVDWDYWFFGTGLCKKPDFDTTLADIVYGLVDKWRTLCPGSNQAESATKEPFEPSPKDLEGWNSSQMSLFIEEINDLEPLPPPEQIVTMGEVYGFTDNPNLRLSSRYYCITMKAGDVTHVDRVVQIMDTFGIAYLLALLYKDLMKLRPALAEETFEKNRNFYHSTAKTLIKQWSGIGKKKAQ
ncbi:hypothetical protein MMC25_003906 [Agyrium rufum]|nr:hypothetical protein [Agyrium rufum]